MILNWLSSLKTPTKVEAETRILSKKEKAQLQDKWVNRPPANALSDNEKAIISAISKKTSLRNQNNITRTHAYWDLFHKNSELHWAYLAHMVSRNAGWNMTDLKGGAVTQLLSYDKTAVFFRFLEKANFLIFQDAFPQLLLYEKSKVDRRDYSYLLPHFGVSQFMIPIWQLFLEGKNKNMEMLTVSLIVNEQHFLEVHVMQNAFFQKHVIQSLTFQLQERLGFTHILFPYHTQTATNLAGLTVQQFSNVTSRIEFGKKLYALLFKNVTVLNGSLSFASKTEHTGSREDYFSKIFSSKEEPAKIFSPALTSVWPDSHHPPIKSMEWFKDFSELMRFYTLPKTIESNDMTTKHLLNMVKLSGLNELKQFVPIEKSLGQN